MGFLLRGLRVFVASACFAIAGNVDGFAADVLEITADTVLDPAKTYGPIVIKKSGVTLDGRGALVQGATEGKPKNFKGVGISAKGVSDVTLVDVRVKGFETGLAVEDGKNWKIEDCDFSDNFHDPDFGWGEQGRRGGIVLSRVTKSRVARNRANRVWDACVLFESNENEIVGNDFSRTSNTCLKLWNASHNRVTENNLSYGIRKNPGEVHARDSTSVLIESGSNHNHFEKNNCRYGGDGIFIRVLNGWVSTDNVFVENDCSYANNNCVEAWSPRNTYIRNRANHGSYGFWLGASDQTVLKGNEASYNGLATGNHNSPHLPKDGHAGIVFMFGPSSHTVVRGNKCVGNNGAGIAAIGDLDKPSKYKAFHWIIEGNTLSENRWGIYLKNADWIALASNYYRKNSQGDLFQDGGVTNLVELPGPTGFDQSYENPRARAYAPSRAKVGEPIKFDASLSTGDSRRKLTYRWDIGALSDQAAFEHTFRKPGFYRVGLTVHDGTSFDMLSRDLYVVEDVAEFGTEGSSKNWTYQDPESTLAFADDSDQLIAGKSALYAFASKYSGGRLNLLYPSTKDAGIALAGKKAFVFWWKSINENLPSWQDVNPIVTLHQDDKNYVRLTPKSDLLSHPPYIEAREGWTYFDVPLAGDETWKREVTGEVKTINYITIGVDSWGAPKLRIWLDGMAIK